MKTVSYCVCCKNENVEMFPSGIHQFVVDRMCGTKLLPQSVTPGFVINCSTCGYVGSDIRFSLEEEKRYYQNYMDDEYIEHRVIYDGPNIRPQVSVYEQQHYINTRKNAAIEVISKNLDINTIKSVLDFGGNLGEMIPDQFNNISRYVVEVQERLLVNGVISISDHTRINPVDLVICAHTLEHVSFPNDLLIEIKKYMQSGTWFYLEVPFENLHKNIIFHEHINIFNEQCLKFLMAKHNFTNVSYHKLNYEAHAVIGQLI